MSCYNEDPITSGYIHLYIYIYVEGPLLEN